MGNLVQWIMEAANGEEILGVVIGEMGWGDYGCEVVPKYAQQPKNTLISWDVAKEFLDYEFSGGFGHPECNAIYAWTPNNVLFISQYDGSTNLESVPRHPIDCTPIMPGG